ncbi:hypothetical protein JK628_15400 [Shewanella sp. KX20019]|uniref:hypothetical protein n=1 Tax=Shewanella sp. KX20019 TaxID=2803864 RepID=UPI00192889B3|nr:hypothetical protein [Shewanella sp. KX20019]QQX78939.1 hypothetical protein JK628_15400 [Shewanella sp. KX20019]
MVSLNANFKHLIDSQAFNITSRALAATFGGYLLSATACGLLAIILPLAPVQSTLTAMMLSFSIYAAAIIWVFSVRHHQLAWRDLLTLSGLFYLIILLVS